MTIDFLPPIHPITTPAETKAFKTMLKFMERPYSLPQIFAETPQRSWVIRMLNAVGLFRQKPKNTVISKPSDNILLN